LLLSFTLDAVLFILSNLIPWWPENILHMISTYSLSRTMFHVSLWLLMGVGFYNR
jgi:hypothetical protein